ncbi:MAG: hypothetical protein ACR2HG_15720 [Pyrinomonadaceae bacterium]
MNVETKNRWQIRLVTITIFLLGFFAGAVALNAYHLWFGAEKRQTKQQRYDEALDSLQLNETQKAEVQKTIGDLRDQIQKLRQEDEPQIQEIRTQTDARLQKILTPDQWSKFQALREKIRHSEN